MNLDFLNFKCLLLLGVLLPGCALQSHFDSDRTSPIYHNGGSRLVFPTLGPTLRMVLDPGMNTKQNQTLNPKRTNVEEEAALGVLLSGLSLVINQDYYKSSYLSGQCLCRSEASELEVPCSNILVALYDEKGKELSRILTEDGEFVFPTEVSKHYRLGVISKKYFLAENQKMALVRGDTVVLKLKSRAGNTFKAE